jgi:hypothetical protein
VVLIRTRHRAASSLLEMDQGIAQQSEGSSRHGATLPKPLTSDVGLVPLELAHGRETDRVRLEAAEGDVARKRGDHGVYGLAVDGIEWRQRTFDLTRLRAVQAD